MVTLPNILSFLRFPLAFLFLQENILLRVSAIIGAMITDYLDGYLARRNRRISRLGTILDPLSDKFFVAFALVVLVMEFRLTGAEAVALMCRDCSVMLFGIYLLMTGKLGAYRFRSIWCGKISTTMQFIVLLGLTVQITFPIYVYMSFIVVGLMALVELYWTKSYAYSKAAPTN